jgi:hypothetical protein
LIVESGQAFDNIDAILHRYESLANTRAEYLVKYQQLMAECSCDEADYAKALDVRRSHVIGSAMKYNEMLSRIKPAKKLNEYHYTTMMKDLQRIEDKITEIATIQTSIRTLYQRADNRSSATAGDTQKKKGEWSEEAILMFVESRFLDLRDLIKDAPAIAPRSRT